MTAKDKRAADRARRRGAVHVEDVVDEAIDDADGGLSGGARRAAREAATAAAVAAAVGAVRALTGQGSDAHGDTEQDEPPAEETSTFGREDTGAEGSEPSQDSSTADTDGEERTPRSERMTSEPRRPPPPREGAKPGQVQRAVERAREQLEALVGTNPESISAFERVHDGWAVTLEVVEVHRVPESTDVLASYRVELDDDLDLLKYERVARYHRADAGDRSRQ